MFPLLGDFGYTLSKGYVRAFNSWGLEKCTYARGLFLF